MDHESTGELFQAAVGGDAAAWKALVERLSPLVWSVIRAHGLSRTDGQEVFQTTWFRLAQHLRRIREPDKVSSWLATTARNESLKALRAARRFTLSDDVETLEWAADEHTPEQAVIASEEAVVQAERARQLWKAFQELGENCQRLLRVLMGSPPSSYREVAVALDIAVGSIGPMRQRCLRRLRDLLAERGVR
ncbi:RNA polymerase sigma factor (sigma-70 family) [Nonomuraea polychroma]|uniref:RNA polymerase sigma factor (Sigma-70 family) n=1 Tax=Nonomuraea polychroma TaxID=46176 RepID=A0A438LZL5_9ACTN|nr:sigma-70 family RNA polymerase sigma factor [Nonomuraea polychroma]RVX38986.1 RNA polymerase sigma factor (sigma-70 family) [Nonomuraea polychroma]